MHALLGAGPSCVRCGVSATVEDENGIDPGRFNLSGVCVPTFLGIEN